MNLRVYLVLKGLTQKDFAELIDYKVTYLREVMSGRLPAGAKLIRAIEKATEGEVKGHEIQNPSQKNKSATKADSEK